MGSETPVRNQFGTIVGLQSKEEADTVQATLDASMQAVGAIPEVAPPSSIPTKRILPPPPSLRIEMIALVVVLVAVGLTFLSKGKSPVPQVIIPTLTAAPTRTPRPTMTPTNIIPINPRLVALSSITVYGDYDEETKIGSSPEGVSCTIAGQSPDGKWVYLICPAPTNKVWAKVEDLELTAEQRSVLLDSRIVSRVVPTVPAFSPSPVQGAGPSLAFCADRSSIWGTTHQCASTQAAADALADSEIERINGTAVAINQGATH
jgi:hypothetical protein